jgi:hypothetical protein
MADDNSVLERYAEAVRSGAYPGTHPVSKEYNDGKDIYPQPDDVAPIDRPVQIVQPESFWQRNKWYIVGIILSALLSGILLYIAFKPSPKVFIDSKLEQIEVKLDQFQAALEDPGTDIELEKIQAWERLQTKLITEFFATNQGPGVKALCISMADQDRCISSAASAKKARKLLQQMN